MDYLESYSQMKHDGELSEVPIDKSLNPIDFYPNHTSVFKEIGPLPIEALLVGVTTEKESDDDRDYNFPVLMNMDVPATNGILLFGDEGTGKTQFLKSIARAVNHYHFGNSVQVAVITYHPEEWEDVKIQEENMIGVFPAYHNSACDLVSSLSGWAHSNRGSNAKVILLIDDITTIVNMDFDIRQTFRWLLLRGAVRGVWPIVTTNAKDANLYADWYEAFIGGKMASKTTNTHLLVEQLGVDAVKINSDLRPNEFMMPEGDHILKFWTPS